MTFSKRVLSNGINGIKVEWIGKERKRIKWSGVETVHTCLHAHVYDVYEYV